MGPGMIRPGNLLSLSDAFRRKSVTIGEPAMEQMARETTDFVGNVSHYFTEYPMDWPENRRITANLTARLANLRALARACEWPEMVLPFEPADANLHYVWVRDAVLPRLEQGLRIRFQARAYQGPVIEADDARRDVSTVFTEGYRGMVHLARTYGPTHPRRRQFLPLG